MKRSVFFTILIIFANLLQAQSIHISGTVTDEWRNPLPAANVFVEGTIDGSISDDEGNFSFQIDAKSAFTVVCVYVGYREWRQELDYVPGRDQTLEIVLVQEAVLGEQVLVTASSFSSGEQEGVTLTPLEVVRTPGAAADIFRAIKTFPGLQQVDDGAGLFVRGGDVSETVVILDGAYLNHPYRYESPNGGFFGTINPFLARETFFSSGGFSAEYGNALSGTLIIESVDIPVRRALTLGLGLAASSTMLNLPLADGKVGLSLSGNYSNTKPLFKLNGHSRRFSQYPNAYDINMNLMYQYAPRGSLKLFVFREDDNVGIEITRPDDQAFFEGGGTNNLYNLRWRHLSASNWLFTGNLAYSDFAQEQQLAVLDLETKDALYQARFQAEHQLNSFLNWRSGVAFFRNTVGIFGLVPLSDLDIRENAETRRIDTNYASNRGVIFSQLYWRPFNSLGITAGLRYENDSVAEQSFLDPRLSMTLQVTDNWNLLFSTGDYHQFPRPDFYDPFVGNPRLQASRATHYIAGISRQTETSNFRLEGYYKDYQDLWLYNAEINIDNEGSGFARGIDLFLKRKWQRFNGWVSYSYLDAERFWLDAPAAASPEFDITHTMTSVLEIDLAQRWSAGVSYRYATGKPYSSVADLYHDSRVPSYQKMDLNISHLRQFFSGNLTIFYLAVANVLGRENIFDYLYSNDYQRRTAVTSSMLRNVYFGVSVTM